MPSYVVVLICLAVGVSAVVLVMVEVKKRRKPKAGRRQLDMAMVALTQVIRRNPNDGGAFTKLGIIKMKKNDLPGAIGDLSRALEIDASITEARYHRGMALQMSGDANGARKDYQWIMSNSEDPFFKTAVSDRLKALKK